MKTITTVYWMRDRPNDDASKCGFMHHEVFDYTEANRNWIVGQILDAGLNVMIEQGKDGLIIWIDNRRFQKR